MKLSAILFAVAAAAFTGVCASETNAQRLARGLTPLPPVRRATRASTARRSETSGINGSCNTGPVQCCNSITYANSEVASTLIKTLSLVVPADVAVGITCHPLSILGIGGGNKCQTQPVCCENNDFEGLIVVGCSPININVG